MSFQTRQSIPSTFDNDLASYFQQAGWLDQATMQIKSQSTGKSVSLFLGDAGGSFGGTVVLAKTLYAARAMQFVAISHQDYRAHWSDYLNGKTDNACPCGETYTVRMSVPVSFAPFLD